MCEVRGWLALADDFRQCRKTDTDTSMPNLETLLFSNWSYITDPIFPFGIFGHLSPAERKERNMHKFQQVFGIREKLAAGVFQQT